MNQELHELKDVYELEQTLYIQGKVQNIRESAANKQLALAWEAVKEISGRKSTCKSKLKAASEADRLNKWQAPFSKVT